MKYKIINHKGDINIHVSDIKANEEHLHKAFQRCKEGKCSCPTQEYEKVKSFQITNSNESIQLSIKTKDGEKIDIKEIEKCLAHSIEQAPEK